ncbi:hypothetical protein ACRS6B_27315 [Nocardia asteroides]
MDRTQMWMDPNIVAASYAPDAGSAQTVSAKARGAVTATDAATAANATTHIRRRRLRINDLLPVEGLNI